MRLMSAFPWATVEEARHGAGMPNVWPDGPFRKYRVAADRIFLHKNRSTAKRVHTEILGDAGILKGTMVLGDDE